MDDLPLIERMVRTLATNLSVPVTVKIRRFASVEKTVEYAQVGSRGARCCSWLLTSCCGSEEQSAGLCKVGVNMRRQSSQVLLPGWLCAATSAPRSSAADAGASGRVAAGHPRSHTGAEAGQRGAGGLGARARRQAGACRVVVYLPRVAQCSCKWCVVELACRLPPIGCSP